MISTHFTVTNGDNSAVVHSDTIEKLEKAGIITYIHCTRDTKNNCFYLVYKVNA